MSSSDNEKYLHINSKEILQSFDSLFDALKVQHLHYD